MKSRHPDRLLVLAALAVAGLSCDGPCCGPDEVPEIALSLSDLTFEATAGEGDPPARTVSVTNGGTGTLTGLLVTVAYTPGQPGGWLEATLSATTAPTTLTVQATTGALPPGSYGATVSLSAPAAANGSLAVAVTFTVAPPPPAAPSNLRAQAYPTHIDLAWTDHATDEGGFQIWRCTGAGCGDFANIGSVGPDVTTYQNTGLSPSTSYSYRVRAYRGSVVSAFSNVATVVTQALPAIALSAAEASFAATAGGADPDGQGIAVTNGGGGTLDQLAVGTIGYGAGEPTGWLAATLDGTTAPATLTLLATTGALPAGSYHATVPVTSSHAANSPQTVSVTFTVEPAIAAPTNLTATAVSPTRINLAWTDNDPRADEYDVERCEGAGCTTFTRVASIVGTSHSDNFLTPATSYSYRVRVHLLTGVSPYSNVATATTQAPPAIALAPQAVTFTAVAGGADPESQTVDVTNGGGGTLSGLAVSGINYVTGPTGWLTASLDRTTAPATLTFEASVTGLDAGEHTAVVSITSPVATNNPQMVSVTLTVSPAPPAAPSNLTATAVYRTEVWLEWADNSSDEDGFAVERCRGAECTDFVLVASLPANQRSLRDAGLEPGTSYRYRVRAHNGFGSSAYSNTASATTLARLSVTAVGNGAVTSDPAGIACGGGGSACSFEFPGGATVTLTATPTAGWELFEWRGACTGSGACQVVMGGDREVTGSFVERPRIALDPPSAAFSATAGGADPAEQTIAVTNGGGGTLDQLAVGTIVYGTGEPTGWLAATLDQAAAPATLTLRATTGTLPAGSYHATVPVASPVAANTPQTVSVTFTVAAAAPDLTVTGLGGAPFTVSPTSVFPLGEVTLSAFTVRNTGTAASGNFDVGVYLSTDAVLTTQDLRLAGAVFPSLTPGASFDNSAVPVDLPGSVPPGSYHIGVLVDGPGAVGETNEGNNAVTAALTVTQPPPPPAAPSNLVALAASASAINLSWTDNASNESGFYIEGCYAPGLFDFCGPPPYGVPFVQIATVGANVTTYQSLGLSANATYEYRVRAYNAGGPSSYSNVASATTQAAGTPPAPSSLVATAASSSRMSLSWTDNSTNETEFEVWRCLGSTCTTFAQVATIGAGVTSYQDAGLGEATTYRYRVRAENASGPSAFSNIATATTSTASAPPAAPSGFAPTAVTGNDVTLAWTDNATTETGFRLEMCTIGVIPPGGVGGGVCADEQYGEIAVLEANTTSYHVAGLAGSTLYGYRVRAYNSVGSSAYAVTQAQTLPVPAAPSGLTATAVSHDRINLSWTDRSTDETGFRIERCRIFSGTSCSTSFSQIATVGAGVTTYANTSLSPDDTYRYRVLAFNANGVSPYSNTATATTLPIPPPSGLTATALSSGRIRLQWTNNYIGHRILVERCTGAGCTSFAEIAALTDGGATSYTNTGLNPVTSYSYRVRTTLGATASAPSNTATATTPAVPGAPTGLVATVVSSTQINLTWADNSSTESGFLVERCTGESCTNFTQITGTAANATSYSNTTGLVGATTYRYRVRATDGDHHSDYTSVVAATTPPAPGAPAAPTGLVASAVSSSQINLTWVNSATNETGYSVERCTGVGCTNFAPIVTANGVDVTSYQNTGLAAATTYRYRVRVFNAAGNSLYSNTATATTP